LLRKCFYLLILFIQYRNTADYRGMNRFKFYDIHKLSRSGHVIFLPSTYMRVSNFGHFLMSKHGVDLYADRLIRKYILYFKPTYINCFYQELLCPTPRVGGIKQ